MSAIQFADGLHSQVRLIIFCLHFILFTIYQYLFILLIYSSLLDFFLIEYKNLKKSLLMSLLFNLLADEINLNI